MNCNGRSHILLNVASCTVPGKIMQTEADAPPFTELPVEECPSVTRVALVEEEAVAKTMTVKEEAQAEEEEEEEDEEEEEEQVLCDSPILPPGEASTGGNQEPDMVEQVSDEFRYINVRLSGIRATLQR
jgi:hypothetical protein